MKIPHCLTIIFSVFVCTQARAQLVDIDTSLANLATNITSQIQAQHKTKVAVMDFTDIQGNPSGELGKYIAEQLTVDLVMDRKDFSVLDRANLKKILDEHNLTAKGLIDPDTAKKLGQFAGVDTLILGTTVTKGQKVEITIKLITTDTAEIVGATKGEFTNDDDVQQLISKPTAQPGEVDPYAPKPKPEKPKVTKMFGDLLVEAQPLVVVADRQYNLTLSFLNKSATKKMWVALSMDRNNNLLKGGIVNSDGNSFSSTYQGISGIAFDHDYNGYLTKSTELAPGESTAATIKFVSPEQKDAAQGQCDVQVEFLLATESSGQCNIQSFASRIDTR